MLLEIGFDKVYLGVVRRQTRKFRTAYRGHLLRGANEKFYLCYIVDIVRRSDGAVLSVATGSRNCLYSLCTRLKLDIIML